MDFATVNKKLMSGIVTLTFRRIALYIARFVTINLILASILTPAVLGIFNIANSILAFFTFFSDIGLAAAIIQKNKLDQDDLKTTFTIQTFLAFLITSLVIIAAPILGGFYQLDNLGVWLIRALALGFFLTSLKVLPAVLLERELNFKPLVFVEILETAVFCLLLIVLTLTNYGVGAFSISVILQSIVGVVSIYMIAPWKISLGISKTAAKSLLSFGIPFQLNAILALLKDRLIPLVIARMVGATAVGYISWAQNLAFLPLEVMNIIIRVTFPAYSRLQEDKQLLKKTVERSLFLTVLFLYPVLFGLLAIAPSIVEHIVHKDWRPALPLIYLFAINTFWAALSTTFTNILNAVGKIKTTLKIMVMWTILTWIITPFLTQMLGFIGVAVASATISLTSIVPIVIIKKIINVEIVKNIWQPLVCALLMGGMVYYPAQQFARDIWSLLIVILLGGLIYFGLIILIAKEKILSNIKGFKNASY